MNVFFLVLLNLSAAGLLLWSVFRDRAKTRKALKKAWAMALAVLPQFLSILLASRLLLSLLPPQALHTIFGRNTGWTGMSIAVLAGSAAVVPVIAVYPVLAELLASGAAVAPLAAFVGSLTTVGLVTLPLEAEMLGKKNALLRNGLAAFCSVGAALLLEVLYGG